MSCSLLPGSWDPNARLALKQKWKNKMDGTKKKVVSNLCFPLKYLFNAVFSEVNSLTSISRLHNLLNVYCYSQGVNPESRIQKTNKVLDIIYSSIILQSWVKRQPTNVKGVEIKDGVFDGTLE